MFRILKMLIYSFEKRKHNPEFVQLHRVVMEFESDFIVGLDAEQRKEYFNLEMALYFISDEEFNKFADVVYEKSKGFFNP